MPKLEKSDLRYTGYSWTAVSGDDPTKTTLDAKRFSRHEGYEVLDLLNSFTAQNGGILILKFAKFVNGLSMSISHQISKIVRL